jgi:hypothetical protein
VKRLIAVGVFLALGGCSALSPLTGGPGAETHQETLKMLGEHISACDRHYQGGVGLGANFTFNIDYKAQTAPQD